MHFVYSILFFGYFSLYMSIMQSCIYSLQRQLRKDPFQLQAVQRPRYEVLLAIC